MSDMRVEIGQMLSNGYGWVGRYADQGLGFLMPETLGFCRPMPDIPSGDRLKAAPGVQLTLCKITIEPVLDDDGRPVEHSALQVVPSLFEEEQ